MPPFVRLTPKQYYARTFFLILTSAMRKSGR
jgi:hypothetical protein